MRRASRDGFTLIEALVAFAIVAAATLVVQRSLVQSRAATAQVSARVAPEWLARSLLAEPLSDLDISMGGRSGVEGNRRFTVRLTPLTDLDEDRTTPPPDHPADRQVRWLPMRVSVSVESDHATWLTVQTIKLGRIVAEKPVPKGG